MVCDNERQALDAAYRAMQEIDADEKAAWERLDAAESNLERTCGYFNVHGEFVIDPIEPGELDFEPPSCPVRFGEWLGALWDYGDLREDLLSAKEQVDALQAEYDACMHEATAQQTPGLA